MAENLSAAELTKAFLDAMREFNSGGNLPGAGGAGGGRMAPDVGPAASNVQGLIKQVDEYTDRVKVGNGALDTYTRMMQLSGGTFVHVTDQMKRLDAAIDDARKAEDLNAQAILEERRAHLQNTAEIRNAKAGLIEFGAQTVKAMKAALPAVGNFVKGLQSGSSATALSGTLMNAGIDAAAGSAQGLAAGMSGAGTAMAGMKGRVGGVGKALAVLGPIVGMVAGSMSKLAKTGVSIMNKEVERTIAVFQTASSTGAMFSDGMTGMRNAALNAGLTTESFSKVLQTNSSILSQAGIGISEASVMLGSTLKRGGGQMRRELLNLGYSFEEQGSLVAETMANMRQSGKALTQGDTAAIADQTRKYAENLRIVSSITGEDAKKKMDQIKIEAQQLAFQQKLQEFDIKERDNINQAMLNMSTQQRKNFQETLVFGQVINKEGAALEATSTAYAASTQQMVEAAKAGKLDADSARKIIAASSADIKKDLLASKELGMAGMAGVGGIAESLSKAMTEELQWRNKNTADAIAAAEKATKDQKVTDDKLTETVTTNTNIANDLAVKTQEILKQVLPLFSSFQEKTLSYTKSLVTAVEKFVGQQKGKNSDGTDKDWLERQMNRVGLSKEGDENAGWAGAASGAVDGAMLGATVGTFAGPVGTAIGAAVGGIIGGALGWFSKGSSDGGLVTGKDSGYLHKLHGQELIVPIEGGKPKEESKGYAHALNIFGKSQEKEQGGVLKSAFGWAKSAFGFGKKKAGKDEGGSTTGDVLGGAASGAAAGAVIGSIVPVVGTAVGGIIGGLVGGVTSLFSGKSKDEAKKVTPIDAKDKEEEGGWFSAIANKVTSIADTVTEAVGLKDPTDAERAEAAKKAAGDAGFGGEEAAVVARPTSVILEEQLMLLQQITENIGILNGTTNEQVSYQKTLVENSW